MSDFKVSSMQHLLLGMITYRGLSRPQPGIERRVERTFDVDLIKRRMPGVDEHVALSRNHGARHA